MAKTPPDPKATKRGCLNGTLDGNEGILRLWSWWDKGG